MLKWRWFGVGVLLTGLPFSILAIKDASREEGREVVLSGKAEIIEVTEIPELYDLPQPSPLSSMAPVERPVPPEATPTLEPTPTPVPTATPDVWSPAVYEPLLSQYAAMYGVDKNVLERLANCESHFNPSAVSGAYGGMFQFGPMTWQKYRGMMGMDANLDLRYNVEESIRTAAYAISVSGLTMWPSCL